MCWKPLRQTVTQRNSDAVNSQSPLPATFFTVARARAPRYDGLHHQAIGVLTTPLQVTEHASA